MGSLLDSSEAGVSNGLKAGGGAGGGGISFGSGAVGEGEGTAGSSKIGLSLNGSKEGGGGGGSGRGGRLSVSFRTSPAGFEGEVLNGSNDCGFGNTFVYDFGWLVSFSGLPFSVSFSSAGSGSSLFGSSTLGGLIFFEIFLLLEGVVFCLGFLTSILEFELELSISSFSIFFGFAVGIFCPVSKS